jgi:hypothetical protein
MKKLLERLKAITWIQWLAVVLIVIGIAIMIPKGKGMGDFYKEVKYAQENNFAAGNLSPDLLRPWMSLRYVAAAYAVPQPYLYQALGIQAKPETSMLGLNRLNNQLKLGMVDGQPAIMQTVRNAIVQYRAHPVVTGMLEREVEDWMTIQYIANSSGIPAAVIFKEIGVPAEGNAFKPLGFLSDEVNYTGGPKALLAAIQKVVDAQGLKIQPDQPVHP